VIVSELSGDDVLRRELGLDGRRIRLPVKVQRGLTRVDLRVTGDRASSAPAGAPVARMENVQLVRGG
jgi:hypothetical protein